MCEWMVNEWYQFILIHIDWKSWYLKLFWFPLYIEKAKWTFIILI